VRVRDRLQVTVVVSHANVLGQEAQALDRRTGNALFQVLDVFRPGAQGVGQLHLRLPVFLTQLPNRFPHELS